MRSGTPRTAGFSIPARVAAYTSRMAGAEAGGGVSHRVELTYWRRGALLGVGFGTVSGAEKFISLAGPGRAGSDWRESGYQPSRGLLGYRVLVGCRAVGMPTWLSAWD